jgi:integrase
MQLDFRAARIRLLRSEGDVYLWWPTATTLVEATVCTHHAFYVSETIMREVIPEIRVKMTRFRSGERFPVLLDKRGLPLCEPISYFQPKRRLAVSTLEGKARTLAMVHNFLRAYDIDFRKRLLEGRVLDHAEASALRDHMRSIGRRTEAIRTRRKCEDPKAPTKDIVELHEWYRRRVLAADYLKWLTDGLKNALTLPPDIEKRITARIEQAKTLIVDDRKPRDNPAPAALSPEQGLVLLDAIRPGSETNPFREGHQLRNFALIATYWENGLRKSEVLALKCEDLSAEGEPPTLTLESRPDDPDETRAQPASVKTLPRPVPITPILHGVLTEYKNRGRRLTQVALQARGDKAALKRFKSNPYLFVSSQGSALSSSSVHKIFDTLRMRTADLPVHLSPHVLRRTWNDMFTELCRDTATGPRETILREFLMGWVRGSPEAARYTRQSTQREASRAILEMQQEWMARREAANEI